MVIVSPSSLAPLSLPRSLALPGVISLRSSSLVSIIIIISIISHPPSSHQPQTTSTFFHLIPTFSFPFSFTSSVYQSGPSDQIISPLILLPLSLGTLSYPHSSPFL
ncbi:uncharacterized protein BO72DRAFT_24514 [Aspergillus fijiensis CBS 313.89]|uniref:Uncharacterized protein n=1 Tax=Aspergillus fijiensis CBS 313.89 TaxID=1448319 RepID=A0A8G1W491_9EURO|nr:uncharacterized protein BO72DRAFT_24514 [Aspergillus fijiensis CBS 313.89]RAK79924.1 hypothetical protein BO72DRAFT_24514 [Aspergillus fijiensis CBS 313.89]